MAAVQANMMTSASGPSITSKTLPWRHHQARRGFTGLVLAFIVLTVLAGAEPQVARVPQRIVSFVPAATEMLFAMGVGHRVVGVSSYDQFPEDVVRIPRVGGLLDPNVERVLALKPDLTIVYGTQTELRTQLERAGIELYVYTHRDLSDVTSTLRALGAQVSAGTAAEAVAADLTRRFDAVRTRVAGKPRPRTLLVFGRERGSLRQIRASGGYGFLHDLLELAGGTDVWSEVKRESVEMSTEMVLTRAPDVIVELHYGRSLDATDVNAERRVWDALPGVPAVRAGRVHLLEGDHFVVPGPRLAEAAEQLAAAIHP